MADQKRISPDLQRAMGFALAVIDMAGAMKPPEGTSATEALSTYAQVVETAAIEEFGLAEWSGFVAAVARQAG